LLPAQLRPRVRVLIRVLVLHRSKVAPDLQSRQREGWNCDLQVFGVGHGTPRACLADFEWIQLIALKERAK
jgi:hypothetical protein